MLEINIEWIGIRDRNLSHPVILFCAGIGSEKIDVEVKDELYRFAYAFNLQ